ncbi:hypothetical protein PENFLA_c109G10161 [Penicillium flavigenum]|uniref:Uncharacterized protein n=1 Tax=Penicillium flavigenum TaxID=254877 RepID=A0A1V6S621_9EURO|nr:hypothetical protein PENFLA_c109G10161 [Penicillium flavigenum]
MTTMVLLEHIQAGKSFIGPTYP